MNGFVKVISVDTVVVHDNTKRIPYMEVIARTDDQTIAFHISTRYGDVVNEALVGKVLQVVAEFDAYGVDYNYYKLKSFKVVNSA